MISSQQNMMKHFGFRVIISENEFAKRMYMNDTEEENMENRQPVKCMNRGLILEC